jgi:imidazolonepropionase-like amidohydrolase
MLIENGKIKEVGEPSRLHPKVPAGTQTIDLGNATLLPGLIDSHTHLFLDIIVPPKAEASRHSNGIFAPGLLLAIAESPSKRALMAAQAAREDLESGITTVRNLGHSGIDGDTELRDAINAGRVPGTKILAAGRKLITKGSYLQNLNPALADQILQQEFLFIDGPDVARQSVRQNVFQNVDIIRITADENLSVPERAAVVQEAHRQHLRVAVHASDTASIQTAIERGSGFYRARQPGDVTLCCDGTAQPDLRRASPPRRAGSRGEHGGRPLGPVRGDAGAGIAGEAAWHPLLARAARAGRRAAGRLR